MIEFPKTATYISDKAQHDKFGDSSLVVAWLNAYPMLIDEDDVSNAFSQAKEGYHFHEWLANILTCPFS